ncbi:DNA repair protein recA homolog 1, chloroplastic-like [Malus domestica]|uniref:DNA repair protein recA homolog 1, chloroplastic-like n=1 Tax=Malus domestica TaxID=3750 RepID=UPI0010AA48B5|nr:DNA repair protein recA homolog 1, chloroplastic-like [Malus domestica]XP_028953491.1 DNA repair protein recA homolog 1, chloroplastic-like [Malus domestica]
MNDINGSFGKGSVTRLGSAGGALVETFPSGCLTLDLALGGGLPKGRIVEKLGGNAMLVDAEHAFDPAYSKALGVDVENLIVCQPDHGEMALENWCILWESRSDIWRNCIKILCLSSA